MASDQFINANEIDTDEKYKETNLVARPKIKTIYEHLDLYSKEQVDAVLEGLSEKDKNIIRARYGNDLDNPVAQKMTMEDSNRFYSLLLPKMKKLLSNPNGERKTRRIKTIYELLDSYSKEQVDTMLGNLSKEEKALVVARYGDDLDNPVDRKMTMEDSSRFYRHLLPKMKKLLSNPNGERKTRRIKTIYEFFDSYTKEQIDTMLGNLSEEEKALVVARYGDDLDNPLSTKLVKEESVKFYSVLVPRMRKLLANHTGQRKTKMFYEFFDSYSREQVDAVLEMLSDKDRDVIKAICGDNLDNPVPKNMNMKDRSRFYGYLVPKIETLLTNPIEQENLKTIYENFDSYSRKQVDAMLDKLSKRDKELIKARYGDDLDNQVFRKLTIEEHSEFYNFLVPKMEKLLANSIGQRKAKMFYEFFDSYSREQVDAVLEKLPEKDRKIIRARYGSDLDNPVFKKMTKEETVEFYSKLVPKMRRLLSNHTEEIKVRKIKTSKIKTIYELLDSYSREQVDAMLENLSEEDKALIAARYGDDLNNPIFQKMTKEETAEFYSKLVPKMRRLLYNPTGERKTKKIKTIYELLGSYSREQVDTMLGNLSEEEKALVVARYGNDLDNPLSTKLVKEESIKFYNYLVPRMRKLLSKSNEKIESKTMPSEEIEILSNNQEFNIPVLTEEIPEDDLSSVNTKIMTRDDCIKTLQLIPGILKTMDICSSREIGLVSLVMSLKLGCIEGKCFSNSDISEILGIESHEVIDITKKALLACKREISQFVDSTIEILDEEPDKKDNKVFYKVLPDNKNPKA